MPQIKVSLSIGIANARQEDILDISQEEWDEADSKEDLMHSYWMDWSNNYIDGGVTLIE